MRRFSTVSAPLTLCVTWHASKRATEPLPLLPFPVPGAHPLLQERRGVAGIIMVGGPMEPMPMIAAITLLLLRHREAEEVTALAIMMATTTTWTA